MYKKAINWRRSSSLRTSNCGYEEFMEVVRRSSIKSTEHYPQTRSGGHEVPWSWEPKTTTLVHIEKLKTKEPKKLHFSIIPTFVVDHYLNASGQASLFLHELRRLVVDIVLYLSCSSRIKCWSDPISTARFVIGHKRRNSAHKRPKLNALRQTPGANYASTFNRRIPSWTEKSYMESIVVVTAFEVEEPIRQVCVDQRSPIDQQEQSHEGINCIQQTALLSDVPITGRLNWATYLTIH